MISKILNTLEQGLNVMRSNSRLLLVAILVFVFPLLFVSVTQSFFSTAYHNINTSEKNRIGILHDSLSAIIKDTPDYKPVVEKLIATYTKENPDIVKIRIVDRDNTGFKILVANDPSLVGTYEKTDQAYQTLPLSGSNNSFIYESTIDGVRTWQAFRSVDTGDNELYIFSEQHFDLIDSVMTARRQQSYFGLTAIFVFLIALAYWLNRQVNWEANHKLLAEQLKERDLFSNMIAHEFRSPLTAIKGYASFLQESKNMDKEELRFAANIRNSAERLVVLVNDFLEVARLQSGKMQIEEKEIDLSEVLSSVIQDLTVMAEEKGLSLKCAQAKKPIIMLSDSARMTQVFTNIISNSIKYTEKGTIEIECTSMPGEVIVRIKDSGMGISAEDQQKLFAPFSRVGGVEHTSVTGTGLGMWITKQLVELLNGTIGVESIKGVGTHVVITFKTA